MSSTTRILALVVTLLAAGTGCAFGNRTVRLSWPPPGQALAPDPDAAAPAVAMAAVVDRRPEPRGVVGSVRNGLYMHTADVESDADLPAWTSAALVDELHRAGVRVVHPGEGVPQLDAELRVLAADAYFLYSGDAELRACLRRGDGLAFDKLVRGQGSAGMNWAATGAGYTATLSAALGDAARRVAEDVAEALRQPGPAAGPSPSPPAEAAAPTPSPQVRATPPGPPPAPPARPAPGPVRFYLASSYDIGFTDLAKVTFTDGSTRRLGANGGVALAVGATFLEREEGRFSTRATVGLKYDAINAANGSLRYFAFPLELVEQANAGPLRFAGGLSLSLGSRLIGSGAGQELAARFDPSLGLLAEVRWVFGPRRAGGPGLGIGPRLLWQRLREKAGGQAVDASAIGLTIDGTL